MLGWLKSLFVKGTVGDGPNVFRPSERLVYHYFDGKKMVRSDPLVLYRRIMDVKAQLSADISTSEVKESKFAEQAGKNAVTTIRKIFDLPPVDQGGLEDVDAWELFDHFFNYVLTLKKSTPTSPTSPEGTSSSTPPTPPLQAAASLTPNSSGFGSTANGSRTGEPIPLPSVSESHSEPPPQALPSGRTVPMA